MLPLPQVIIAGWSQQTSRSEIKFHKRSFLFIYLFITLIKRVSQLRRLYKQSGRFRSVWKPLYVADFKGLA
jgi:hypothetical protein